ncbi:cellulose binding domain-containing protein [Actinomadura sp.]|uniref:GH12 family glycosyl hydrolase domain-containing protein n=1 Tax=Actinomadura sp. TaxID=1989 RepID=UPI0037C68CD2
MRVRALIALAAVVTGLSVATPAHAAQVTTCNGDDTVTLQGGEYIYQQNEWNSSATQCADVDTSSGAWTITQTGYSLPANGAPATYPSTFKGCHWGTCTANSGLPIQVAKLGSARSSWSTTQVASGAYDAAYDLWFNSTPSTGGQPDGTELMIWINSRGGVQPFGSRTGTVDLAGHSWDVWTGDQTSWKIISYVLRGGATSVSNLDVKALIDDSVTRGSLNRDHYLLDAEAGFEIWQGGQGLATNSFSFAAAEGTDDGGGDDDGDPGSSSGCQASYQVANDWGSGFTASVTVTNTGTSATHGWKVTWSYGGGQTVSNAWNTALTQSGSAVTAVNMPYNGTIAPNSSTSFGFQGAYSGSNPAPTLTCTAS